MDLIPIITDIVLYFLGALVLVLAISYSYSKMVGNKKENESDKLIEKRKHIRQYIIHQNQYITSTTTGSRKNLRLQNYSPPVYSTDIVSRRSTDVNKITNTKRNSSSSTSTGKSSKENFRRYSIVNDSIAKTSETLHINPSTNSYSAIKEQHYYHS